MCRSVRLVRFYSHLDKIFLGTDGSVYRLEWINLDCEGCVFSDDKECCCLLDECQIEIERLSLLNYLNGGSYEPPSC